MSVSTGYSDEPEAFGANFERDKELLRQMGLPLREPLDPAHPEELGYRIPPRAVRAARSRPRRGRAGGLAAGGRPPSSSTGPGAGRRTVRALRKLGGRAGAGPGPAGDPARPGPPAGDAGLAALPGGDWWPAPFGAIAERRQVRFVYRQRGPGGGPVAAVVPARPVVPGRLRPRTRGEERLFRLDRMAGPLAVEGPPAAFARPPATAAGAAASVAARRRRRDRGRAAGGRRSGPVGGGRPGRGSGHRSPAPDGSVVFEVAVTNMAAFRSFVLGFLDHAEILGPPACARTWSMADSWLNRSPGRARRPPSRPARTEPRAPAGATVPAVARPSAEDRLGRLLAIVPWVAAHDGPGGGRGVPALRGGGDGAARRPRAAVPLRRPPLHARRADRGGRRRRAGVDPDGGLLPPAPAAEPAGGTGPGVGRLGPARGARRRSRRGPGHRPWPSWRTCSASGPTTASTSSWPR